MNFKRKKNLIIFLLLCSLIAFNSGCKKKSNTQEEDKQPTADFTTDKAEYVEGEIINLTSTSSDASTYRWTMPDGQTVKSANTTYQIETLSVDRSIQFKLEAISQSGTKSDYIVKNIPVKAKVGQLVIYNTYYNGNWSATATIDGTINQIVMPETKQEPNCGEGGHPTFSLKAGTHYVDVRVGTSPLWSGNVTINQGQCTKLRVQ